MVMDVEERTSTEERVSRIEGVLPHLAAKSDVAESETRVTRQIADLRTETRTGFAELRKENVESEARVTRQIADLRTETRTQIAETEARVTQQIADLRTETQTQIAKSETRMIRWMIAIASLMVAAITLIDRLFG